MLARHGLHVVTLDLRGHGDSAWSPEGDYGVRPCAADVLAVLAQVGTPTVLVGASLGGLTSLMVVDQAPQQVKALVLVDIVLRYEPTGAERIRDFMTSAPTGFASLEEAAEAVAAYLPHRPRPDTIEGLRKNLRRHPDGRWHWHWDPAWFSPAFGASMVDVLEELDEAARRIGVPTLLLHGERSDVVGEQGVEHFRELVPHAEVLELSDAAHTAAADDNDGFVAAVVDMCRRHLDLAV